VDKIALRYDLTSAVKTLDAHEWTEYARRIGKIPGLSGLGAFEALHAEAADGNSPAVQDWPRHTREDLTWMRDQGINPDDIEGCQKAWHDCYDIEETFREED